MRRASDAAWKPENNERKQDSVRVSGPGLHPDTVTRDNSLVLLGKYHCLNVYLWHPVFITVVTVAFGILGLSNSDAAAFAKPVLVAAGAIILSLIIFILGKSFNKKVQA